MSNYTEYAEQAAQRYDVLHGIGQPDVALSENCAPVYVRRAPEYTHQEKARFQESLDRARKRAHEGQIRQHLEVWPRFELVDRAPFGVPILVQEAVQREARMVLLGSAGAGKTTALRFLASQSDGPAVKPVRPLTFLVDLPAFAVSQQSLPEYLAADAEEQMSLSLPPSFFQEALIRGEALVCLDGLDEIPSQSERAMVIGEIESWTKRFPRCRYIVTARPNGYEPALSRDDFAHYALIPGSKTAVADLERRWQEASEGWSDEELDAQRSAAPRVIQDVLAAREMVAVLKEKGVDALWDELCAHLWDAAWREPLAIVWRLLAQEHPDVWSTLLNRLLQAGADDPLNSALHRYVHAAALALAASGESDALDEAIRKRIVDGVMTWLTDPEAAGRQDAVELLFQMTDEPLAFEQVLGIAQQGPKAEETAPEEVEQDADAEDDDAGSVDEAADPESSWDEWTREATMWLMGALGRRDPGRASDALLACVDNAQEGEHTRQAAASSLGQLVASGALDGGDRASLEEELLKRFRNPEVGIVLRGAIGEALSLALSATKSPAVVEGFTALARGEGEEQKVPYSVQTAAARGLGLYLSSTQDADLVARLWELVRDEEVDDGVRSELAGTLGKVDNAAQAAGILMDLARHPKILPPGRRQAMERLAALGYCDESIVEGLVTIAETKDRQTKDFERLAAARALCQLGQVDVGMQHVLMLIADKSIYRSTRNDALQYLGGSGFSGDEDLDNAAIAVLQIWLTEPNTTEDVRERAMQSLISLGVNQDEVVRNWIGVIQDKQDYPRVRRVGAELISLLPLGEGQQAMVAEALSTVLYDPDEKSDLLRVPIAHLLVKWQDDEHALVYLRAAAEESYMALVRYKAGMILAELGEMPMAVSTLLKLAQDSSIADPIRCDSLRALGLWKTGDEEMVEAFLPILQEPDLVPNVREATYSALKSIVMA